jgi:hypothetical protein
LLIRLGQPFGTFLLARQCVGEYRRIASDHDIIAQVLERHRFCSQLDGTCQNLGSIVAGF